MPAALSLVPAGGPPAPTIPFGDDFEAKVMTLLLTNARFARAVSDSLVPAHFLDQQNRILAEHTLNYLGKYRTLIDPKVLLRDFVMADRRVSKPELPDFAKKIVAHFGRTVTDGQYVQDRLLEWARNQTLLQLMIEGPRLIEAGRAEELDRRWKRAMSIGEQRGEEKVEYYTSFEARAERRKLVKAGTIKRGVTTGWEELDKHISSKGWKRRGLTIILAGTKRGKTMFKLQSALRSSAQYGAHNLYISLEVDEDVGTDRLDAAFTGTPISDIENEIDKVRDVLKSFEPSPLRGSLWFQRLPSGTLTPAGLEAIIERHLDEGHKLDAVFVDYMGIMKTRPEHRYDDLGHIAVELRRIADVYDVAMITGYQTNRDGMGKVVADATTAGDSFKPMQDADLVLSINADEGELRADVRRIYFALTRGEPQVTIKVQGDLSRGRLIEKITQVKL